MKESTINRRDKLTIAASTALIIFEIYKIVQSLLTLKNPSFDLLVVRLLIALLYSIENISLLALGLCGLVLVYANMYRDKDLDFQNKLSRVKNIVFTTFIVLTACSLLRSIYFVYVSFQSYQTAIASGADVSKITATSMIISTLTILIIGIFSFSGKFLFGIYSINKNANLLKPLVITYFTGFAFTFIIRIYRIANIIIFYYSRVYIVDGGNSKERINSIIISFTDEILVLVASMIIILYGIKKAKTPDKETSNFSPSE